MSGRAPVQAPPAPPARFARRGRTTASRGRTGAAAVFLAPAGLLLGALVLYPIVATVIFSFQDRFGRTYVGFENYTELFTNPRILQAIRNNLIWVLVVPMLVTAIGLVFAVLTERIPYDRAFKTVVFMPMAISLLAGGVIWRVVYDENPERGLMNAAARAAAGVFRPPGPYAGATPSAGVRTEGNTMELEGILEDGDTVALGLLGLAPGDVPEEAQQAQAPRGTPGTVSGIVFRDFRPGGGGTRGEPDPGELGLPGIRVEVREPTGAEAVASAITDDAGRFTIRNLDPGTYSVVLPASNFRGAFEGFQWLGPTLITPAIIVAYIWIWAGFAMVVIGAGLSAISREVLEAARVDGASERQIFRRITVPLLAPVLGVVLVTLVINVLKVFDIVLVIAPSTVQDDANVIALEMWRQAFGARNLGLGSAVAVLLFVFVVPVIALNVRRFKAEQG